MNEFCPTCEAAADLPGFKQFPAFLTINDAGIYEAHAHMHGVFAVAKLSHALSWLRHVTGRTDGAVPVWNRRTMTWDGEYELNSSE